MKVIVTGGAGYIGSHTCKCLAENGFEPVVFDSLFRGDRQQVKWGAFIEGDIGDLQSLSRAMKDSGAAAVLHFAARAYVGESVGSPAEYYRTNVVGTLNVLDAMRESGVKHIVFSSSCATYGVPTRVPIREGDSQSPVNPYGWTKLMGEQAIKSYAQAYGLNYAILRYFNAAGCDPECQLEERHTPETHLIPLTILAALKKGNPLSVFGTDYPTEDGSAIRDYVHVSDLATAHLLALRHSLRGGDSLSLNLGTGKGLSVRQIIAAVERLSDLQVPWVSAPRRPGDPPILVADGAAAQSALAFYPKHSDLDEIISTALAGIRRVHGAG